ncbi:hypothetical protein VF12_39070, partial [Nostoc linckia z15]
MKKLGILLLFASNFAIGQSVTGGSNSGSLAATGYAHTVGEIYVVPANQQGASGGTVASATQLIFSSLGTADFVTVQGVTYHPNPVQDYLTVSLPETYDLSRAELFDIGGKKIPVRFLGNKLDMG